MRFSPWESVQISAPSAEEIRARVFRPSSGSVTKDGCGCRSLCFLQWLGKVFILGRSESTLPCRSGQHARKPVWGADVGPSACHLQTGRGFLDSQPPADLSFCHQHWAVPAPVDLSALICRQKDACIIYIYIYVYDLTGELIHCLIHHLINAYINK